MREGEKRSVRRKKNKEVRDKLEQRYDHDLQDYKPLPLFPSHCSHTPYKRQSSS